MEEKEKMMKEKKDLNEKKRPEGLLFLFCTYKQMLVKSIYYYIYFFVFIVFIGFIVFIVFIELVLVLELEAHFDDCVFVLGFDFL